MDECKVESVKWYKSKTVIINLSMLAALVVNDYATLLNIDAKTQVLIVGVANLILRVFTGKPLELNGKGLGCAIVFALTLTMSACAALNGMNLNVSQGKIAFNYDMSSLISQEQGVNTWIDNTNSLSDEQKVKQLNNLIEWKSKIDAAKEAVK